MSLVTTPETDLSPDRSCSSRPASVHDGFRGPRPGRYDGWDDHRHRTERFCGPGAVLAAAEAGRRRPRLEARHCGSTDFAPAMGVINMLIEEGALAAPQLGRTQTSGWADPVEHPRMLHDDRRTGDYLAAFAAAVRPGDVVLDIGTGSGVLAVAAARAGARHVYAIEASDIAGVAERVFGAQRGGGPGHVAPRVVEAGRVAGASRPPGRRGHRERTVRGGDPGTTSSMPAAVCSSRVALLVPNTLTLLRPPRSRCRRPRSGSGPLVPPRSRALAGLIYDIDFQPLLDAEHAAGGGHTVTEGEIVATWPQAGHPVVLASLDLMTFDRTLR